LPILKLKRDLRRNMPARLAEQGPAAPEIN